MSELKAIIFDMDGVLINSTPTNNESMNLVLADYGIHITKDEFKKYLGRSLRDQLKAWEIDFGLPKNVDFMDFSKRAFKHQIEILSKTYERDVLLLNLIRDARSQGIKVGVGTSSTKYRAEELLRLVGVFDNLDAFIAQDDIQKHKPDPEVFLTVASKLNIAPENCVVIEDAVNGLQAARAANMKSVAKLTDFHDIEDFDGWADLVFENFSDLSIERLNKLFSK